MRDIIALGARSPDHGKLAPSRFVIIEPGTKAALVARLEALAADSAPEAARRLQGNLQAAHQHRDIIERFGRYPHRNATLGRPSTPEEMAFLQMPGSSF